MLKETVQVHGYTDSQFSQFVGKMLTQAEVLGLPTGQEKSFKQIVTNMIWELWENPKFIDEKEWNFGETS